MRRSRAQLVILVALLSLSACSPVVPRSWICGTYAASYPYGTSTIVLHRNGRFTQRVALKGHVPVVMHGRWYLHPSYSEGSIVFYGSLDVQDGFGHLRRHWQVPTKWPYRSRPLSIIWFRIQMDDSSVYPYIKQ